MRSGSAPTIVRPLKKSVGVELTPTRAPASTSSPMRARVAEEALALEVLVVLDQDVVVLPEAVLPSRTLRRARGEAGVGMERRLHVAVAAGVEREVPEHEAHVAPAAHHVVQVAERL